MHSTSRFMRLVVSSCSLLYSEFSVPLASLCSFSSPLSSLGHFSRSSSLFVPCAKEQSCDAIAHHLAEYIEWENIQDISIYFSEANGETLFRLESSSCLNILLEKMHSLWYLHGSIFRKWLILGFYRNISEIYLHLL